MGWLIGRSMSVVLPFEVGGPSREVASRVGSKAKTIRSASAFLALLAMPLLSGGCLTQAMWMSALEDVEEGGPQAVHPESVIDGAIDANDELRLAVAYDDGATVMLRVARDRLARAGADAEPPQAVEERSGAGLPPSAAPVAIVENLAAEASPTATEPPPAGSAPPPVFEVQRAISGGRILLRESETGALLVATAPTRSVDDRAWPIVGALLLTPITVAIDLPFIAFWAMTTGDHDDDDDDDRGTPGGPRTPDPRVRERPQDAGGSTTPGSSPGGRQNGPRRADPRAPDPRDPPS